MKQFFIGVIVTVVVGVAVACGAAKVGLIPGNADASPGGVESFLAKTALDAYVERNAPQGEAPVPLNDENLRAGMKVYKDQCLGCHGGAKEESNPFAQAMYPPIPQFGSRGLHDEPAEIFFIAKHGIRLSGMPAFGRAQDPLLKDDDLWKVALFIHNIKTLPPAIAKEYAAK